MDYPVSVIIPVYNCEKFVQRAVESVIKQNNSQRYQILLIDDGSKDNSGKICDEFSEKYENVFAFHQENAGVSAARNLGIEKAEGEWISFIDCDDYILDGFFDSMLSGEKADLMCCEFSIQCPGFRYISDFIEEGIYHKKDFKEFLYPLMTEPTVFYSACTKLFRNEIIKKNNLRFVVGMKLAEDMTFVYEYVKYIESFKFVNKRLYYYYLLEGSASNVVSKGFEAFKSTFLYHSDYFKEFDSDGEIQRKLQLNFLMNAVDSISVAANTLHFFEGVKYIRSVLNDEIFYSNYSLRPICFYAKGIFKLLDKRILKKQAAFIYLLVNMNTIRLKITSKLSRGA